MKIQITWIGAYIHKRQFTFGCFTVTNRNLKLPPISCMRFCHLLAEHNKWLQLVLGQWDLLGLNGACRDFTVPKHSVFQISFIGPLVYQWPRKFLFCGLRKLCSFRPLCPSSKHTLHTRWASAPVWDLDYSFNIHVTHHGKNGKIWDSNVKERPWCLILLWMHAPVFWTKSILTTCSSTPLKIYAHVHML